MREYRNGDRVRHETRGTGTIVHYKSPENIGVDFDIGFSAAHNCEGRAKPGCGWYVDGRRLTLLDVGIDVDAFFDELESEPPTPPRPQRVIRPSDNTQSITEVMKEMAEQIRAGANVGLDLSDFLPKATPVNFMDAVREGQGTTNESEENPLKLNDITQGLPLLGLRIMINPKYNHYYNERYHGESGILVNLRGNKKDAYRKITQYKNEGKTELWRCTILFDNGRESDISIEHMIPIIPKKEVILHEIEFSEDKVIWTPKEYEQNLDEYIIKFQWNLKNHIIWNDEERQKVLDAH